MKTFTKSIVAASFCLVAAVPVYAGHGYHDDRDFLRDRMERQQERIENGIRSGELTRGEVKTLRKQQRQIRKMARSFREDGWLSERERRILNKKLNRAGRTIKELKHNDFSRDVGRGRYQRYEACCEYTDMHVDRGRDRVKNEDRMKGKSKGDSNGRG